MCEQLAITPNNHQDKYIPIGAINGNWGLLLLDSLGKWFAEVDVPCSQWAIENISQLKAKGIDSDRLECIIECVDRVISSDGATRERIAQAEAYEVLLKDVTDHLKLNSIDLGAVSQ